MRSGDGEALSPSLLYVVARQRRKIYAHGRQMSVGRARVLRAFKGALKPLEILIRAWSLEYIAYTWGNSSFFWIINWLGKNFLWVYGGVKRGEIFS